MAKMDCRRSPRGEGQEARLFDGTGSGRASAGIQLSIDRRYFRGESCARRDLGRNVSGAGETAEPR